MGKITFKCMSPLLCNFNCVIKFISVKVKNVTDVYIYLLVILNKMFNWISSVDCLKF